jgi:hypothetical protein
MAEGALDVSPVSARPPELITAGLGLWIVAGAALDAWSHAHDPTLETFFTPWHGVLYSGVGAAAAWLVVSWRRSHDRTNRLSLIGIGLFLIGGVGDLAWHSVFGVERGAGATFSPTHMLLYAAAVIVLSAPARSTWTRGEPLIPMVVSVLAIQTVTLMIFTFTSPFTFPRLPDACMGGRWCAIGVPPILLWNLLVFGPWLAVVARFGTIPGSAMATAVIPTGISMLVVGGELVPSRFVALTLAGLVIEAIAAFIQPSAKRPTQLRWMGALAPATFWLLYVAAVQRRPGVGWEAELWTGAVAWTAMSGFALCLLMTAPNPER